MIAIVRGFGAPVTEAGGKSAPRIPASPARVLARTVEVICQSVGYFSTSQIEATSTDPVSAMRPQSFRTISTIITFSARSFVEARSDAARARSSAALRPRGAVPFIGRDSIASPSRRKKSSGEALQSAHSPVSMNAAHEARCAGTIAVKSSNGPPSKRLVSRYV